MRSLIAHKRLNLKRRVIAFADRGLVALRSRAPKPIAQALTAARRRALKIDARRRASRIAALQAELVSLRASPGSQIQRLGEAAEGTRGASAEARPGLGLGAGDPHYRAWVGPPQAYDLRASMQVSLLLAAGLRETHQLVEVGCGSLRAGRMLIPYLLPGHYFGIEPTRWVVEEGIKHELGEDILRIKRPSFRFVDDFSATGFEVEFDFALAQSVFSHTYPDMTLAGLSGVSKALAPNGKLFANFVETETTSEDGSGWLYPGCTTYTWERMREIIEVSGLVARKIEWLPGMRWFVAAKPGHEEEIDGLARRLRPPLVTVGPAIAPNRAERGPQ